MKLFIYAIEGDMGNNGTERYKLLIANSKEEADGLIGYPNSWIRYVKELPIHSGIIGDF